MWEEARVLVATLEHKRARKLFFMRTGIAKEEILERETDLRSHKSEVSSISAGSGATLAPVDESEGVEGVLGEAERIDKGCGEGGFLEAVGAALAVEAGEDEADGAEVLAAGVNPIQERPEPLPLLDCLPVAEHRLEHADQQPEPHSSVRHLVDRSKLAVAE